MKIEFNKNSFTISSNRKTKAVLGKFEEKQGVFFRTIQNDKGVNFIFPGHFKKFFSLKREKDGFIIEGNKKCKQLTNQDIKIADIKSIEVIDKKYMIVETKSGKEFAMNCVYGGSEFDNGENYSIYVGELNKNLNNDEMSK